LLLSNILNKDFNKSRLYKIKWGLNHEKIDHRELDYGEIEHGEIDHGGMTNK
jgi:hypothetical protein